MIASYICPHAQQVVVAARQAQHFRTFGAMGLHRLTLPAVPVFLPERRDRQVHVVEQPPLGIVPDHAFDPKKAGQPLTWSRDPETWRAEKFPLVYHVLADPSAELS